MFTIEQRDNVRDRVLEMARADPRVTGGALTGSMAIGAEDEWSDIDVTFGSQMAPTSKPSSMIGRSI